MYNAAAGPSRPPLRPTVAPARPPYSHPYAHPIPNPNPILPRRGFQYRRPRGEDTQPNEVSRSNRIHSVPTVRSTVDPTRVSRQDLNPQLASRPSFGRPMPLPPSDPKGKGRVPPSVLEGAPPSNSKTAEQKPAPPTGPSEMSKAQRKALRKAAYKQAQSNLPRKPRDMWDDIRPRTTSGPDDSFRKMVRDEDEEERINQSSVQAFYPGPDNLVPPPPPPPAGQTQDLEKAPRSTSSSLPPPQVRSQFALKKPSVGPPMADSAEQTEENWEGRSEQWVTKKKAKLRKNAAKKARKAAKLEAEMAAADVEEVAVLLEDGQGSSQPPIQQPTEQVVDQPDVVVLTSSPSQQDRQTPRSTGQNQALSEVIVLSSSPEKGDFPILRRPSPFNQLPSTAPSDAPMNGPLPSHDSRPPSSTHPQSNALLEIVSFSPPSGPINHLSSSTSAARKRPRSPSEDGPQLPEAKKALSPPKDDWPAAPSGPHEAELTTGWNGWETQSENDELDEMDDVQPVESHPHVLHDQPPPPLPEQVNFDPSATDSNIQADRAQARFEEMKRKNLRALRRPPPQPSPARPPSFNPSDRVRTPPKTKSTPGEESRPDAEASLQTREVEVEEEDVPTWRTEATSAPERMQVDKSVDIAVAQDERPDVPVNELPSVAPSLSRRSPSPNDQPASPHLLPPPDEDVKPTLLQPHRTSPPAASPASTEQRRGVASWTASQLPDACNLKGDRLPQERNRARQVFRRLREFELQNECKRVTRSLWIAGGLALDWELDEEQGTWTQLWPVEVHRGSVSKKKFLEQEKRWIEEKGWSVIAADQLRDGSGVQISWMREPASASPPTQDPPVAIPTFPTPAQDSKSEERYRAGSSAREASRTASAPAHSPSPVKHKPTPPDPRPTATIVVKTEPMSVDVPIPGPSATRDVDQTTVSQRTTLSPFPPTADSLTAAFQQVVNRFIPFAETLRAVDANHDDMGAIEQGLLHFENMARIGETLRALHGRATANGRRSG